MGRRIDRVRGESRVLNFGGRDVIPAQVHEVEEEAAKRLRDRGASTPPIYELRPEDAGLYYEQFQAAIAGNPLAAVLVDRGLDAYRAPDTRLFVTDDFRAGGALFGKELGSLFSLGGSPYKRVSRALAEVRRQAGGEYIVCRGTRLRSLNETSGFVAVAETPGPSLPVELPGDHGFVSIMIHDPQGLQDGVKPVRVETKEQLKATALEYLDTLRDHGRTAAYEYLAALHADNPAEQQVREQMTTDPIRARTDAELEADIRNLRRITSGRDEYGLWSLSAAGESNLEDMLARHQQLVAQAEAIEVVRGTRAAVTSAVEAVDDARADIARAQRELTALPAFRFRARQEKQQELSTLEAVERQKQSDLTQAQTAAAEAVTAARAIDALPYGLRGEAGLDAVEPDPQVMAAQLAHAEQLDAKQQAIRDRAAQRVETAARTLDATTAEQERRAGLSLGDAELEGRVRQPQLASSGRGPDVIQQHAVIQQQAEADRQQHRDTGPEL